MTYKCLGNELFVIRPENLVSSTILPFFGPASIDIKKCLITGFLRLECLADELERRGKERGEGAEECIEGDPPQRDEDEPPGGPAVPRGKPSIAQTEQEEDSDFEDDYREKGPVQTGGLRIGDVIGVWLDLCGNRRLRLVELAHDNEALR